MTAEERARVAAEAQIECNRFGLDDGTSVLVEANARLLRLDEPPMTFGELGSLAQQVIAARNAIAGERREAQRAVKLAGEAVESKRVTRSGEWEEPPDAWLQSIDRRPYLHKSWAYIREASDFAYPVRHDAVGWELRVERDRHLLWDLVNQDLQRDHKMTISLATLEAELKELGYQWIAASEEIPAGVSVEDFEL